VNHQLVRLENVEASGVDGDVEEANENALVVGAANSLLLAHSGSSDDSERGTSNYRLVNITSTLMVKMHLRPTTTLPTDATRVRTPRRPPTAENTPGSLLACLKFMSLVGLQARKKMTYETGDFAALLVLSIALFERNTGPASDLDGGGGSKDGEGEGDGSKVEAHVELFEKAVVRRAISLKNIC